MTNKIPPRMLRDLDSFSGNIIPDGSDLTEALQSLESGIEARAPNTVVTTASDGLMSFLDKVKLNGIAVGATANDTNANLRNRSLHTGTQAISTVAGLQTVLDEKSSLTDLASPISNKGVGLLGFNPTSTYAAGTLGARLKSFVYATDFGAKGDGVTDDTVAIQTAMDYVRARGGGTVAFPDGAYKLSASTKGVTLDNQGVAVSSASACLLQYAGVSLVGLGRRTARLFTTNNTLSVIFQVAPVNCEVSRLEIHANWTTGSSGAGMGIMTIGTQGGADFSCRNNRYSDLYIHNVGSYGIGLQCGTPTGCTIENIDVFMTGADSLDLKARQTITPDPIGNYVKNVTIREHGSRVTGSAGIDIRGVWQVSNVTVVDFGVNPALEYCGIRFRTKPPASEIYLGAGAKSTVSNVYVRPLAGTTALTHGIQSGSDDASISNVVVENCTNGYSATGNGQGSARYATLSNFHALNCSQYGFSIGAGCDDHTLVGCHSRGSGLYGIWNAANRLSIYAHSSVGEIYKWTSISASATEISPVTQDMLITKTDINKASFSMSRSAFVTANNGNQFSLSVDGQIINCDGFLYQRKTGSTVIPDLPGWVPNKNTVFPQQFGAKGDGVTDDTVAIQNAMDYVYSLGGGIVAFIDGGYKVTASRLTEIHDNDGVAVPASSSCLIQKSNVALVGVGRRTARIFTTDNTRNVIAQIAPVNCEISRLEIHADWNTGGSGAGHGIIVLGTQGGADISCRSNIYSDLLVRNVASYGIGLQLGCPTRCKLMNIDLYMTGADSLDLKARQTTTPDPNGNVVMNITVRNHGSRVTGSAGVDLRGIWHASNITVVDFGGNAALDYIGVRVRTEPPPEEEYQRAGARCIVNNVYVRPTIGAAATTIIGVQNGSDDVVINNVITEDCTYGYSASGNSNGVAQHATISNFIAIASRVYGFFIGAGVEDQTLIGCHSRNSGSFGIFNAGIRTIIRGHSSTNEVEKSTAVASAPTESIEATVTQLNTKIDITRGSYSMSRLTFVTQNSAGVFNGTNNGQVMMCEGLSYERVAGSTVISDLVGWVPSRNNVSPEHFGAKRDGTTDDTVPIQKAIDYVGTSGGGAVYFQPGVYRVHVSAPTFGSSNFNGCAIKLPYSNTILQGASRGGTIIRSLSSQGGYGVIQMLVAPIQNNNPSVLNSGIKNITIDGNYTGTTSGSAPMVYGVGLVDCIFDDVMFTRSSHYLLGLQNGGHQGVVVNNCWFVDNVRDAIDIKNNINPATNTSSGKGIQITGCHFKRNCRGGWDGISPYASLDVMSPGVLIDNCHFYEFATDNVSVTQNAAIRIKPGVDGDTANRGFGARYSSISNVYIHLLDTERKLEAAIQIWSPYVIVNNVHILGRFDYGIRMTQGYSQVRGGNIQGSTISAVFLENGGATVSSYEFAGADNVIIDGIVFDNTPIGVDTSRSDVTVTNCTFKSGVTTNCFRSTGSSNRNMVTFNRMNESPAAVKINISAAGATIIQENMGAPGKLTQISSNLGVNIVKVNESLRFFTGYDGSDPGSGSEQLRITGFTNSVNRVNIQGATTGQQVLISGIGTDTDVGIRIQGQGAGVLQLSSATGKIGFFATAGALKQTITGSRSSGVVLQNLLQALAAYGLIVDSTTS